MIFCVEDDSGIRDLMIYTLNAAGFEAVGFGDDAAFWEAMKQQRPELILLDIMLPGEDGISILKSLQRLTKGNIKTTTKWTVNLTENAARLHKRAAFLRDRERRKTYQKAGLK